MTPALAFACLATMSNVPKPVSDYFSKIGAKGGKTVTAKKLEHLRRLGESRRIKKADTVATACQQAEG